jgi:signal transduction histidine kinase
MVGHRLVLLDVLAAIGFFLLPQVSFAHPAADVSSAAAWGLPAAAALPLCVRRIWPLRVFLCVIVVSCVALPFGLAPTCLLAASYAIYTVAVTQSRAPRWSTAVIGGISAVVAAGLTLAGSRNSQGGTEVTQVLLGIVALGATWAIGASVRERRAAVRRAIEQAAERARTEERLRVAREFHDIATHSIGLIAVKVGVANHVLLTHPEEARDALQVIEQVSRTALRDMRTVLRVLRTVQDHTVQDHTVHDHTVHDHTVQDHTVQGHSRHDTGGDLHAGPSLADVPALIDEARAADVDARLETRYAQQPPQGVALSAYRIIQEALTNVIKHAAPTRCQVSIDADAAAITIVISDDGPKHDPDPEHDLTEDRRARDPGGGLGLIGMRERAAAHGGTLTAQPRPGGGFRVTAILRY